MVFFENVSKLGRGFSEIVVHKERIYHKMDHLLRMVNTPVLTDIEVGLKSDEIEIYPFPIPDLFIGAPVIIKADYVSMEPLKKIAVRGWNPHGDMETLQCKIETRNDIPVHLINCLTECQIMTADVRFTKSTKLENKVIDYSKRIGVPSVYTSLIDLKHH